MANIHVATSPLTNRVYAGGIRKDGYSWGANKTDVTGEACGAVAEHVIRHGGAVIVSNHGKPVFEISVKRLEKKEAT